jgi:hypothetical protein
MSFPQQGQDACRFRAEWEDNDGRVRERHFTSYDAAKRFSFEIEIALFDEALQNIQERKPRASASVKRRSSPRRKPVASREA